MPYVFRLARPMVLVSLLSAALALGLAVQGRGAQPPAPALALASLPVELDSDGDGYANILEKYLASDESNPASTPEHMAVAPSARFPDVLWPEACDDGSDNDGDGNTDGADGGCAVPALAPFEGDIPLPGVYGFPASATLDTEDGTFDLAGPFVVELGQRQGGVLPIEIVALQLQTADGVVTILESPPDVSGGTIESQGAGDPFFPATSTIGASVVLTSGGQTTPPLPLMLTNEEVRCLPPAGFPLPCRGHVPEQGCYVAEGTPTSLCPEWPAEATPPTPSPTPTPEAHIHGDVDCDEDVDTVDSLKVLRHVAGLTLSQDEPCPDIGTGDPVFGDIDCDGDVDSVDSLRILRHVGALSNSLPPGCGPVGT